MLLCVEPSLCGVQEESLLRAKEEEERRKEISAKFQVLYFIIPISSQTKLCNGRFIFKTDLKNIFCDVQFLSVLLTGYLSIGDPLFAGCSNPNPN